MIPAEVIERARAAAYGAFPFRDAYNEEDLSPAADAALRSLLTDLRGEFADNAAFQHRAPNSERAYGWEDATAEIVTLLRELGDE